MKNNSGNNEDPKARRWLIDANSRDSTLNCWCDVEGSSAGMD